ncbi:hypothetical protein F4604DRAFT_1749944 [Suillus subluteus]|nr:hypothetical protein F4604DRAFT_1749944 [Suillus subluteus]
MTSKMQCDIWLRLRVSEIRLILNDSGPVNLFRLVINPQSFSQSVEILFHLSYLFLDQFCKRHCFNVLYSFVTSCCSP